MSEEEKKAIENLKTDIRYSDLLTSYNDNIDTILNLIQKQEKVIDEMAEYMENVDYTEQLCEYCINDKKECTKKECIEQIKQYFYIKVENNE